MDLVPIKLFSIKILHFLQYLLISHQQICQKTRVIKHLNTLHATRQAFITAEFSRKLKLALRKQTRNTPDFFEIGGKVYFKRNMIKNGVVLVMLSDSAVQLFILDKAEYCTKPMVHVHNSLLISNIHQHSTQSTYQLIMTICKQIKHYKKQIQIQQIVTLMMKFTMANL